MNTRDIVNVSRRRFLAGGLASVTALTLGLLPTAQAEQKAADATKEVKPDTAAKVAASESSEFAPNAFLRIDQNGWVTVISKHLEMGQGTYTGLATLVAEELDADWDKVKVEGAPADASKYNNLLWGRAQGTGGSTAIANSFDQMRRAGATAKHMLKKAAAEQWKVDVEDIEVSQGILEHKASGKKAGFGELVNLAAKQPLPDDIELKEPKDFKLIGKRISRKDSDEKINGSAQFTADVRLPNMKTALVLHPPRFGARVKTVDDKAALAIEGVHKVVHIPSGVAVVADDFWSAKLGRDALTVTWDESKAFTKSSTQLLDEFQALAKKPGAVARHEGDVDKTLATAKEVVEAEYSVPYLAHAAMEPLDCVVRIGDKGCEIWNGEQMQSGDQMSVAATLGLKPEQVTLNMLYAGGSFGRRANPAADYILEAVHIAKALDKGIPVKLIWMREDDMRGGYYRPMYLHKVRASLDKDGKPEAWDQRIVGQSILAGTPLEAMMVKDGIDHTSVEGAQNLPYAIQHLRVDLHSPRLPVPVLWWRSVGSTHTAFAGECFIDELAHKAGQDPVEYRRKLLADHPRHLAVLNLAAEKAGWGAAMRKDQGLGGTRIL